MPMRRVDTAAIPSTAGTSTAANGAFSNGTAAVASTADGPAAPGSDKDAVIQRLTSDVMPSAVPPGVQPGSSSVWSFPSSFSQHGVVTFNPPGHIAYTYDVPGSRQHTELLAAPTEPGRCKVGHGCRTRRW